MPKFHQLRVAEIRRETDDCVSVALEVPAALAADYRFLPGQYLTLKQQIDGEEVRRTYSICSAPTDEELRVAIKRVPGGRFSTFANEKLRAGDALEVMTPLGNFTTPLQPEHAKHYVAFAAGSGITPVLSLMKSVLAVEPRSRFTLFYGNRRTDSIIFREQIEALKNVYLQRLSVYHVLSREHTGSEWFSGRIDQEKCRFYFDRLVEPSEVDEFFLCGPAPMIETVQTLLAERGVDKKRVHRELFTTGATAVKREKKVRPAGDRVEANIRIRLDGNELTFPLSSDGATILDAALAGGADLPFACKGGVCSTCRAKLLEGEVEMDVNYALEDEEVAAGYILTCQSHPVSDQVVVDFDA